MYLVGDCFFDKNEILITWVITTGAVLGAELGNSWRLGVVPGRDFSLTRLWYIIKSFHQTLEICSNSRRTPGPHADW